MRYIPKTWTRRLDPSSIFGAAPERLEVDLGCGKGRFLLARAAAYPQVSFLGLDRLLLRLEKVERKAGALGLNNIRLVYVEADYAVRYLIPEKSVSTYYIFFPDPWPKSRHHSRRLFNESFLDALAETLVPGGAAHIATDHQEYFGELRFLFANHRLYREIPAFTPAEEERTDFELIFAGLGRKTYRCSFSAS